MQVFVLQMTCLVTLNPKFSCTMLKPRTWCTNFKVVVFHVDLSSVVAAFCTVKCNTFKGLPAYLNEDLNCFCKTHYYEIESSLSLSFVSPLL